MTSMKVIALDIETSNLDMDIDGLTFDDPTGWNTSCVAIHDHHRNGTFVYVRNPEELCLNETENVFPFSFLASDLEEWFYSGYLLVTKNGSSFDLPIISKSVENGGCGEKVAKMLKLFTDAPTKRELDIGTFKDIPPRYIDICEYIRNSTGVRRSLQSLIQGTFGLSESKLMSAAEAPENWAAGEHQKVLDYCASDARYTADLFYFGRREGRIFARDTESYSDPIQIKTAW
jgi:hypothetical protein